MRYARIRDEFEGRIASGDLKPGDQIPPETVLAVEYETSRATVARALRDLDRKGLLTRRRGSGTFVKAPPDQPNALRLAMFTPWALQGEPIGYFQSQLFASFNSQCAEDGAEIALQGLASTGDDYRSQLFGAADQLLKRKTAAVYFCPAELPHDEMAVNRELVDHLQRHGCRVVLIDRDIELYPDRSGLPWVAYDNRRGAAQLTAHLVEQGYKRIAFVGIARDSTAVIDRLAGYADGLRDAGRTLDQALLFQTDSPDAAFVSKMMKSGKPDAIVAKDSLYAAMIGALLLKDGVRLGADVGLAGFDDNPAASVLPVPLTIVRQPVEPFVRVAHALMHRVLDDHHLPGEQIVIPTELVRRASTARG